MALQTARDFQSKLRMSLVLCPHPGGDIGRQAKPSMIGTGYAGYHAVDGADLGARAGRLRPVGEHRTGGMGMGENQGSVGASDIARIFRALVRLAAASRSLDDDERGVRTQGGMDGAIAHGGRSASSGRPT